MNLLSYLRVYVFRRTYFVNMISCGQRASSTRSTNLMVVVRGQEGKDDKACRYIRTALTPGDLGHRRNMPRVTATGQSGPSQPQARTVYHSHKPKILSSHIAVYARDRQARESSRCGGCICQLSALVVVPPPSSLSSSRVCSSSPVYIRHGKS